MQNAKLTEIAGALGPPLSCMQIISVHLSEVVGRSGPVAPGELGVETWHWATLGNIQRSQGLRSPMVN